MTIYVAHSRNYDYKNELYLPLRQSELNKQHTFILPHETSDEPFASKDLLRSGKCDLLLAEVSHAATGQGIELGWADSFGVKIVCLYKKGAKISGSLKVVTSTFIEYDNSEDLITKLTDTIHLISAS